MDIVELQQYISQQINKMSEDDIRFVNQIRILIKKYIEEKEGRR